MVFLCVSDIHGHLDALRAILASAERRSFERLLVAGDICFPGPEPLETWRRLTGAQAVIVQGVVDRAVASLDPKAISAKSKEDEEKLLRLSETQNELGELIVHKLGRLPTTARFPLEDGRELLLVHGSPRDPSEAMTFDMTDDELNALIGDDPADVVVCGMSHVPFDREVMGVRIINVGSVGEAPDGREPGGAPRVAHATWIDSSPSGISVEQFAVPLDAGR